jgi:hypothetical protein
MGIGHYYFDEMRSSFNLIQTQLLFQARRPQLTLVEDDYQQENELNSLYEEQVPGCPFIRHFFIRIMNNFGLLFEYSNNIKNYRF